MSTIHESDHSHRDRLAPYSKYCLVCVNYHSDSDTRNFLKSVAALSDAKGCTVVVVNNSAKSADDRTFDDLRGLGLDLHVVNLPENRGYFGGAQQALEFLKAQGLRSEWVILSNVDIEIRDRDFLPTLSRIFVDQPPAVIAPRIVSNLTNRDQNPFMRQRPSRSRMHFIKWMIRFYPLSVVYGLLSNAKAKALSLKNASHAGAVANETPSASETIYAPHGAFMVFHRTYFESGLDFRHGVFLFGEEISVAEKVREKGLAIVYEPRLCVNHREHVSTGFVRNRKISRFAAEASAYCADTFFGTDSKERS